ncbi:MAG: hypothetical protein JXR70_08125 [Spirochaetales bacterium]|nr:hypothetical protein [Spirochaetales bacterium]
MRKTLIVLIIAFAMFSACADNSPAVQYAGIINHVIAELKKNSDKPQIAGQNIAQYLENNKDKISQLQTSLSGLTNDKMYEYNNTIIIPATELLNLIKGNQNYGQDQNIVNALFLLKIIE